VLTVVTDPLRARVVINGRDVGSAPVTIRDQTPGPIDIQFTRTGYIEAHKQLDLAPGAVIQETITMVKKPSSVEHSAPVRYGYIDLQIDGSWAEIYVGGKKVGVAPLKGLRLAAGRRRLRLYNPNSKREKHLTVEVQAGATRYYRTSLDP
jgi:serine/threonine-protein kinase